MADEIPIPPADNITDNDKVLAALSYPVPLVALIILLVEDLRARPFQRYHAVQALATNAILWAGILLFSCVLGLLSFWLSGACGLVPYLLWLATLYWAYEAYMGKYVEIPWLTQFLRSQNWV